MRTGISSCCRTRVPPVSDCGRARVGQRHGEHVGAPLRGRAAGQDARDGARTAGCLHAVPGALLALLLLLLLLVLCPSVAGCVGVHGLHHQPHVHQQGAEPARKGKHARAMSVKHACQHVVMSHKCLP